MVDAYPMLCALADRVQLSELPFAGSVHSVVDSYASLLSGLGRLSEQQEIGLFGELVFVRHLVDELGTAAAIGAWRGREEHDFGFEEFDVEVKTTTREKRAHWISSFEQLDPSSGRPLWLVSFMLTTGGLAGETLPELIAAVRAVMAGSEQADPFAAKLEATGWNDAQSGLYSRRLHHRQRPGAYPVDAGFPSIARSRLQSAGLDISLILEARYLLDLSAQIAPGRLPHALAGLAEMETASE